MAQQQPSAIGPVMEFLKQGREKHRLGEVMGLAEQMANSLDEAISRTDATLYEEFRAIAGEISSLKREVAALGPDHFRMDRIPEAGLELDAVVEATQEATDSIMSAAETIMAADASDPEAYKAMIDDKMILIFEACSFQDLTGQRIRKVVRTLNWIEERIQGLASKLSFGPGAEPVANEETEEEQRMRELILNGPQMKGAGVSQTAVDDYFAQSDQADIDRLFD